MIAQDKILHFVLGFFLSIMGLFYLPLILMGFAAGAFKEIYDSTGRGKVEAADMLATWCGAGIATGIVVLFIL